MTEIYGEAIQAGLSRREASYVAFARDLKEFLGGLKEEQTLFLHEQGLSWEAARSLDGQGRADLNEKWNAWRQERKPTEDAPVAPRP